MLALDWISVKGFKSIAAIEMLPLRPINVLIGANGSGKSNFIGVFEFLHAIREGRLREYVLKAGGADRILHFGSKVSKSISIQISFEQETCEYDLRLEPSATDELIPTAETVYVLDESRGGRTYEKYDLEGRKKGIVVGGRWTQLASQGKRPLSETAAEAGISIEGHQTHVAEIIRGHLDRSRVYHFHDTSSNSQMKKTADLNDNRYLRPDGSNLAAFLYLLREKHPTSYTLIRAAIRRVTPFFDDFILEPQQLNLDKIRLEWKHLGSDAHFDASSLSDGTLRFVALTTLLLQPDQFHPAVILVDEPELGLHPYAITILASLVKQASQTTQVILSTQSPFLLDNFSPEDVLVANRVKGGTQLSRLERAPLEEWLETYSLGQLWEKNEIGGRPASE